MAEVKFVLVPLVATDAMVDAADWLSRADGRECWRKMVRAGMRAAAAHDAALQDARAEGEEVNRSGNGPRNPPSSPSQGGELT